MPQHQIMNPQCSKLHEECTLPRNLYSASGCSPAADIRCCATYVLLLSSSCLRRFAFRLIASAPLPLYGDYDLARPAIVPVFVKVDPLQEVLVYSGASSY